MPKTRSFCTETTRGQKIANFADKYYITESQQLTKIIKKMPKAPKKGMYQIISQFDSNGLAIRIEPRQTMNRSVRPFESNYTSI